MFDPKKISDNIFFDQISFSIKQKFWPTIFLSRKSFDLNIFWPKFCLIQKKFRPNIFLTQIFFSTQTFWPIFFLAKKIGPNFFRTEINFNQFFFKTKKDSTKKKIRPKKISSKKIFNQNCQTPTISILTKMFMIWDLESGTLDSEFGI